MFICFFLQVLPTEVRTAREWTTSISCATQTTVPSTLKISEPSSANSATPTLSFRVPNITGYLTNIQTVGVLFIEKLRMKFKAGILSSVFDTQNTSSEFFASLLFLLALIFCIRVFRALQAKFKAQTENPLLQSWWNVEIQSLALYFYGFWRRLLL